MELYKTTKEYELGKYNNTQLNFDYQIPLAIHKPSLALKRYANAANA
jgi:hypothetical protein